MPGQVKTRHSADVPRHQPGSPDGLYDHDMSRVNRNTQHSHALRLALGSILTPKRPYSPTSHPQSKSSSGTSSPALSYSFSSPPSSSSTIATPSNPPSPPQPPHTTPLPMHRLPDQYLHNLQHAHAHTPLPHMHQLSHIHTPSRLGMPEHTPSGDYLSSKGDAVPSTATHAHEQPQTDTAAHQGPHPRADAPIHAPKPVQASPAGTAAAPDGHGSGTPRARFIETLQSKSAWDALIHGQFS